MTKRKKNEDDQVSEAMEQAALAKRRHEIKLLPFSEGREFSLVVCTQEIEMLAHMNVVSAIEIGKRLVWAKDRLKHGEFGGWVKDELPFSPVTAWRYMKIADKFKSFSLKDLGLDKIYALAELSDSELKELEAEGHLGDIMADELDKMSPTEMRRRIRRYKEERQEFRDEDQKKQVIIDSLTETNKDLREGNIYTASEKKLINCADVFFGEFLRFLGKMRSVDRMKTHNVALHFADTHRRIAEHAGMELTTFVDTLRADKDESLRNVAHVNDGLNDGGWDGWDPEAETKEETEEGEGKG